MKDNYGNKTLALELFVTIIMALSVGRQFASVSRFSRFKVKNCRKRNKRDTHWWRKYDSLALFSFYAAMSSRPKGHVHKEKFLFICA